MKAKNKVLFHETKRHLSSNLVKIIIVINIIVALVSALKTFSPVGIELFYFDEILFHYFWQGLVLLLFSSFFISIKIMNDSKKNYSLISRFKSKGEFLKNIFYVNIMTISIVIITCYMGTFFAFNIFSSTSLSVRNLENYEYQEVTYVSNLIYMVFFLFRTLILVNLINLFNVMFIYILNKWKVLVLNLLLVYYLLEFNSVVSSNAFIKRVDLGLLDLKRYFRYPIYETFKIEVINSIFVIIIMSVIIYFAIKLIRHLKTVDQ